MQSGNSKVCVILVSVLAMDKFFLGTELGPYSVIPVHFPAYSRGCILLGLMSSWLLPLLFTADEMLEIMAVDCPANQPLPFFRTFVRHIWNVFQSVCLDLSELRSLVSDHNSDVGLC